MVHSAGHRRFFRCHFDMMRADRSEAAAKLTDGALTGRFRVDQSPGHSDNEQTQTSPVGRAADPARVARGSCINSSRQLDKQLLQLIHQRAELVQSAGRADSDTLPAPDPELSGWPALVQRPRDRWTNRRCRRFFVSWTVPAWRWFAQHAWLTWDLSSATVTWRRSSEFGQSSQLIAGGGDPGGVRGRSSRRCPVRHRPDRELNGRPHRRYAGDVRASAGLHLWRGADADSSLPVGHVPTVGSQRSPQQTPGPLAVPAVALSATAPGTTWWQPQAPPRPRRMPRIKPDVAAIASRQAGVNYGLSVLAAQIEDNPDNITRFAVIAADPSERTGRDKTSLLFELDHQPGALADAMAVFKRHRLNLTWIESFPKKGISERVPVLRGIRRPSGRSARSKGDQGPAAKDGQYPNPGLLCPPGSRSVEPRPAGTSVAEQPTAMSEPLRRWLGVICGGAVKRPPTPLRRGPALFSTEASGQRSLSSVGSDPGWVLTAAVAVAMTGDLGQRSPGRVARGHGSGTQREPPDARGRSRGDPRHPSWQFPVGGGRTSFDGQVPRKREASLIQSPIQGELAKRESHRFGTDAATGQGPRNRSGG